MRALKIVEFRPLPEFQRCSLKSREFIASREGRGWLTFQTLIPGERLFIPDPHEFGIYISSLTPGIKNLPLGINSSRARLVAGVPF